MTGPGAKFGAWQAAQIAVEDINREDGINGRPFKLLAEDTHCDGPTAVTAAKRLLDVSHVKFLLGGHCSPDSVPIAPIAQAHKVLMLAAITTTPKLTNAGDYVFRLSPVNLAGAEILAPYLRKTLGVKRIAIIHEETDYAAPPAERLAELFKKLGGEVVALESFDPGMTDFRSMLLRIKRKNPDGLYLGTQAIDSGELIVRQLTELKIEMSLFGNEAVGGLARKESAENPKFNGLVYAEPVFDLSNPSTQAFISKFKKKFGTDLPYGIWTAEAYDSVTLLASLLRKYGEDVEQIKKALYQLKDYHGASGVLSIDKNGDGIRQYRLKRISNGVEQVIKDN